MEEPTKPHEHDPDSPLVMDEKPLSQPRIRHFALIYIIIGLLGVLAVAALVFALSRPATNQSTGNQQPQAQTANQPAGEVVWENLGDGKWGVLSGKAPACPSQVLTQSPTDVGKATSILYPGQTRGGNYKAHGGFRFDTSKNEDITVKSPFDGSVYRGARYLAEGEIQYTFDIINPCGFMVRVGHLRVLSDAFQKIADKFPAATEDSRTERVNPQAQVKAGDVLATAVGIIKDKNTFFDFGVYDLRATNAASQSPAFQQAHISDKELAWYAVCWFDMLPSPDAAKVRSLPAGDPTSGKQSDYCK